MKRIIIAGSRSFNDYQLCYDTLSAFKHHKDIIIVSGKAPGADHQGELVAKSLGWEVDPYPADWDKYGYAAGPIRNRVMAENATHLIAFWNGESSGTKDMIKVAKQKKLLTKIIYYTGEQYERTKDMYM